ncbi:methionine aminotransferase [Chryseobacterium lactis]|uniref:Aminotransferase class I/II-fold pyridoxal phosphate-dependent enzyme n=1 Tax=Chryseobacterium lactis TaxID=1241981 RepID=A0A3G6RMH1_CHRLC|nr:methionine aminotransferase [Chryseobacterium lactis]AZA83983.1 aminotransferase class I/II-fold pyridoxal phosphate-dependent enzyme [Chryseobacterium lactis]AZB04369.1 aminotransferase class I/II-fold pyridoxal phosphate-dependent enzyme [Chryseobacterium lactis]PNW12540.1 methionine aminotransferase [Chryseobacterium lactis]
MIQLPLSKLSNVGTTIFSQMTQLANENEAINLSQGFPDFMPDSGLLDQVDYFIKKGFNQYAPLGGMIGLKEEIARKIENSHQATYHPDSEITVTAGGTQAIFTAIAAFIKKDDEVIIFEPAYDCYEPTVELFGGIVKRFEMKAPDYKIDWSAVKNLVNEKTKMIILNNPNNPSGKILNEEDIRELIQLVEGTSILILSDEVYENIVFDGKQHLSICKYPELKERSLLVASFGKLFHVTGWKVGYCAAPKNLTDEFRKVHQFNVFCVNTPIQLALAAFMKNEEHYTHLNQFFQEKRDFLRKGLAGTSFELLDCEGTYFQAVKYDQISDKNDFDFATELTINHKVATVPFSSFYKNKLNENIIRLCFAKKQETLERAIENLSRI